MKRLLIMMLTAAMLVTATAAVGEEDISILDVSGDELIEEVSYDDVAWQFPVDIGDMDPNLVILANKQMYIEKDFKAGELVTLKTLKVKNGKDNGGVRKASSAEMKLESRCAEALVAMFRAAEEDGIYLYLKSAYRSYQTQKTMYYNRLKANNGKDDGWVTPAGTSDHQTGLGCDIVSKSWRDKSMNSKFAATAEAQWMAEHCAEYGFIIRYPEDKVDITGINYEPWHLRYVGVPSATYIMENGLCLEEFHDQLVQACQQFIDDGGNPVLVEKFMQVSVEY